MFSKGIYVTLPFAFSLALVFWLGLYVNRNFYQPYPPDLLTFTAREISRNLYDGSLASLLLVRRAIDEVRMTMRKDYPYMPS